MGHNLGHVYPGWTIMLRLFWLLLCLLGASNSHAQGYYEQQYQGTEIDLTRSPVATLYKGADKQWVADGLDVGAIYQIVSRESNQWLLTLNFSTTQKVIDNQDVWLQLRSNIDAAEVYLNDHRLLVNGTVGDSIETEQSGNSLVRARISRDFLVAGNNTLTVRFSNFHHQDGAVFRDLAIGQWVEFDRYSKVMSTAPLLFSGIFLFAVFVNIALFLSLNRKAGFALLALLFTLNFVLMAHQALYWNGLLGSNHWLDHYSLRTALEAMIYFTLLLVLQAEFDLSNKHFQAATVLFVGIFAIATFTGWPRSMLLSFVPLIFALSNMAKGHWPVVTSLALVVIFEVLDEYNLVEGYEFVQSHSFVTSMVFKLDYLGMIVFALIMIFVSAKSILAKTRALNQAELKLAQLEFQFVQKHIQPHFLMNTLMSLQQLVRKKPDVASQMIEALSEEFYLLTTMSKQQLVPIEQEIEMCQTHLTIMSIQQSAEYKLQTQGIDGDEMIPPAVFHTLVENGITHGYAGKEAALFTLTKSATDQGICYTMFNNGTVKESDRKSSGSGLHYIESRLEAWQPGLWTLSGGPVENGWQTVIQIKANQ